MLEVGNLFRTEGREGYLFRSSSARKPKTTCFLGNRLIITHKANLMFCSSVIMSFRSTRRLVYTAWLIKLRLVLRPCYTAQFSKQLVWQCLCETSCWRIAQFLCLAIFLLREALHEVELSSTFRNGLQQLATPLHSVSPLQQLVSQFNGSFNKGACAYETSCRENCTV